MSKQPNAESGGAPPSKNAALLLLADAADITWRMFFPTIGATLLGIWLDKQWQTTPWVMIVMIVIGAAIAVLLVRRQIKRIS